MTREKQQSTRPTIASAEEGFGSPKPPSTVPPWRPSPGVRALIAVVVLAVLAGIPLLWFFKFYPGREIVPLSRVGDPETAARLQAEIPFATFLDVTSQSGIQFVHYNGAYGDKLLPETMGGGVAFFDFDQDGAQDLLFVNSCDWPDKPRAHAQSSSLVLYRNDGKGRFHDVTAGSGLEVTLYGMGVATGDYDNDGQVDVFVTAVGGNRLFHNDGQGHFKEVTTSAGLSEVPQFWSTGAAWVDYDNDGRLDLFVCNYVQWSKEIDLKGGGFTMPGLGRAYGPPVNFEGTFPYLYHNEGQGRFTEVSKPAGLQIRTPVSGLPMAKSLAVAPVDVDNDGWADLVVANDTVQNFLFRNRHNGTFEEIGARSGVAFDAYGLARGAMGIDAARFRNDDALGIAIGNFANQMNALYVAQPDSLIFSDDAVTEGMGPASRDLLKFGLCFFDYDLDGRLDVLTANGHLEENISRVNPKQRYRQPAQLFWNRGAARGMSFVPVPVEKCGADLFNPMVGRGLAFADIDGDGDLDVVITQINSPPRLLRNEQNLGHHFVRLKLVGGRCNRDAIGAWIKVRVGNQILSRQVMPTRSYLSQCELPVTIGLGRAEKVQSVEVLWPGGIVQSVPAPKLDALTVVRQGK